MYDHPTARGPVVEQHNEAIGDHGLPTGDSANPGDVHAEWRAMVKSLRCPGCDLEFTDFAVDWGDAWMEGRIDLMNEQDWQERDGPYKLKCELCGHRSWLDYFNSSVRSAEPTNPGASDRP